MRRVVVHYATRRHHYRQIWLVYTENLSVNLSQRQTQSCPQLGNKTRWQTAPGSRFNSNWGRERREHWGREGGREGGSERRRAVTELGGKIEMSNYQMKAVGSSISVAMLGKFWPGFRTKRSCLIFCAPLRSSTHVRPSPVKPTENTRSAAAANPTAATGITWETRLEHAAVSTCVCG